MSTEKFANRPASSVAVAYDATDLTLEVVDASDFPSTGVFRVRLGNIEETIFRVDSVAGNVFTGAAEEFDGDAAIGVTVNIVASKSVAERFMQSPESGEIFSPSGVLGADRYGPLRKVVYPVTADFAWVNQETATLDDQFGFTRISNTVAGGFRARVQTAPSTPYQVDACLQIRDVPHAKRHAGLIFRESSTGKIVVYYIFNDNACRVAYWTDHNTWSSNPAVQTLEGSIIGSLQPVWLRIKDDGTNLKFTCSRDGIYYMTELSLLRGAFMTGTGFPDQIGFAQIGEGGTVPQATDFYHYLVS